MKRKCHFLGKCCVNTNYDDVSDKCEEVGVPEGPEEDVCGAVGQSRVHGHLALRLRLVRLEHKG